MNVTITLIFFIYGLIFGSFFNVVGLRVPKGSLFSQTRSYCDTCERTLTWKELIPTISTKIASTASNSTNVNPSSLFNNCLILFLIFFSPNNFI